MNEYEKFSELIYEKVSTIIKKYEVHLSKRFEDTLKGVEKEPTPLPLTKEEEFYLDIFRHYTEISTSLQNLGYIQVFIDKPFRKSKVYQEAGITRDSYLRYHLGHYLMEIDILKNRMARFLARLIKMLLKEGRVEESKFVLKVKVSFLKSMKGYTKVRDSHIHEARYDETELKRLAGFELASSFTKDENLELVAAFLYGKVKKQWSEQIIKDSNDLRKVTNAIFGALTPIIFALDGQVVG